MSCRNLCEGFHVQIACSLTLAKQILTWKKLTSVYFWASAQKPGEPEVIEHKILRVQSFVGIPNHGYMSLRFRIVNIS
jgi:hypothetical protein